ncbi:flippase [Pontibacter fetidus]|uniref:Flippase n=1 Tax=Pontibacter fetidus TaxID=2700082 RepID=A0A6B2H323_9BACT|nr:flippase [Pontibacter fetidus]NDK57505.1 flippase [Pontibacter fetidus]
MNEGKKGLLKNITSVGFVQIANYVFPMITIPIVSRIVGPDKLGVINFTASFIAYFTLLIGFGFDLTATRKIAADPGNENNRNKVFSEVFTSQSLLFIFSLVVFIISLYTIPELKQEKMVAIYTFLTCLATLFTQNWLFQAMQDLPKVAILNLLSKVIFTIIILIMVKAKEDYIWQPLALSLSQVLIAIISFAWAIKKYRLKFHFIKVSRSLRLLWDEKTFFFSLCIISLYTTTNIVVLGILQDSTQVAYYTSAQKLIAIMQAVITIPLAQAFYPYIGKAFGESYERGIEIAQKLIPIVFVFTFIAGVIIFAGAPIFIKFFYGEAFKPAIEVCRILAFVPMCIALGTIAGIHVMLNLKKDKLFFKVICVGATVSIFLNIFLVKHFGYIGSAYTWAITECFNLVLLVVMLKIHGISILNLTYFKFISYRGKLILLKKLIIKT